MSHCSKCLIFPLDVKKYTPSILDKENGRQSRLNLDDTSFFNELISAITESYKPKKHSKGDSVSDNNPEILLTQNMSSVPKDRKKGKKLSSDHKSSENVLKLSIQNNLLNKVPINGEKTMLVFDETYKNKQQKHHGRKYISTPNKRTRYKKFKYKQSLTAKREAKPVDLSKILQKETIAQTHDEFIVPQLPSGSKMTINVLSTWGDRYYVGLNGIEIFASDGAPVLVKQVSNLVCWYFHTLPVYRLVT